MGLAGPRETQAGTAYTLKKISLGDVLGTAAVAAATVAVPLAVASASDRLV